MNNADRLIKNVSPLTRRIARRQGELILQIGDMIAKRGWTQRKLARAAGITEQHLSRMLAGEANVELRTICQLEDALGEEIFQFPVQIKLERRRAEKRARVEAQRAKHLTQPYITVLFGLRLWSEGAPGGSLGDLRADWPPRIMLSDPVCGAMSMKTDQSYEASNG